MSSDPGLEPTMAPAEPRSLETALLGVVLAQRYRLDSLLGEGGMALVFDGHHLGLDRAIAVKVLKPEFVAEPQVIARFEQEARAVSRLEHPGIVKMYDVGTATLPGLPIDVAFLVMERLRGRELSDVLRDGGAVDEDTALAWMEQMLAAICHAHTRGVVHRDLKPENIFVAESEDGEVLKLVDFGIAKMLEPTGATPLTQMGMIFGTPPYMSPEQATGMPVDARTDLYSMGIILYEMLAGHVPFRSDDMMAVLRMQVHDAPPPLPVSEGMQALLGRLLEKDPEARFEDAQSALSAVKALRAPANESDPPRRATEAAVTVADEVQPSLEAEPQELPAPSPAAAPARPRWLVPAAAAASLALGLGVLAASMGDDETSSDDRAGVSDNASNASPAAKPTRASEDQLAALDALIDGGDRKRAKSDLVTLLEQFPADPELVWRSALLEGNPKRHSDLRAERLVKALELDPDRLAAKDAQAFVLRELKRAEVPEALLDLVLEYGGPMQADWTAALLGRERDALPYPQRHRLLDEAVASGAWDPNTHLCLDLWQAPDTTRPCTVYGETLDAMRAEPNAGFQRSLRSAPVPEEPGDDDGASACEGLAERRDAALAAQDGVAGDASFVPADYEKKAKSKGSRGGKRKKFRPFKKIFGG